LQLLWAVIEMSDELNRCRLILVASAKSVSVGDIKSAVSGGDVASVILYSDGEAEHVFERFCKESVPLIQEADIAALVADDTQAFGKSGADGFFAEREKPQLNDLLARFSPQNIVGCGGFKNRHGALQVGELKPDFLFFGKLSGDIRAEPHPKNLALAQWWSELVQIPAVVMGGNDLETVIECAGTKSEFIALGKAVFENFDGPQEAVKNVNILLDKHAPNLDELDLEEG